MGKFISTGVNDATADEIIANASKLIICSGQPTDYADATTLIDTTGKKLGETTVSGSDFSKAAGSPNGRKLTVGLKDNIAIDAAGSGLTWDHVALVDDANSKLLLVNTLNNARTDINDTDTVKSNSFELTVSAPT